jgi:membrane protein DedA with SNARE-associated domain
VAVQVILFVGIGYYAGEQVEWARASGERIALILGVLSLIIILVTWLSSAYTKKLSRVALDKAKEASGDPS